MVSRNSIYPLPSDGAFSAHINGDHDYVELAEIALKNNIFTFKEKTLK